MSISKDKIEQTKQRFGIVGTSLLLNGAIERAMKVAPTDLSVLITGESGVGKEAFSQVIHSMSKRRHNKFIAVNCGAIPEGTIDSELFGHEKGAFTSAVDTRKGYFETVNGGTIFLDEVGELPLGTQARLLRILETGEFLKVGSSKVQKTDVRIIAATNKNLVESLKQNKFREDLYYRLSTVEIQVPSLQERKEDTMMLFAKFANDFADKHSIPPIELTPEAEQEMQNYSWPGNIRQLKNFVEEISVLEADRTIDASTIRSYMPAEQTTEVERVENTGQQEGGFQSNEEREILYKILFDLKSDVSELKKLMQEFFKSFPSAAAQTPDFQNEGWSPAGQKLLQAASDTPAPDAVNIPEGSNVPYAAQQAEQSINNSETLSLQEQEKEMIKKALAKYQGKRKVAARELGISERTLYRKLKEYNLEDL